MKPRIGIILGDPAGIGPELIAKILSDQEVLDRAEILLIADKPIWEQGLKTAGVAVEVAEIVDLAQADYTSGKPVMLVVETVDPALVKVGRSTEAAGKSQLKLLAMVADLAKTGYLDGFIYGPLNKHSLHLGGMDTPGELEHLVNLVGHTGPVREFNVMDDLWTSRVSSHVAIADVPKLITEERILDSVRILDRTLKRVGRKEPVIAVAALNPHAGESGDCGDEEIRIIGPAVEKAVAEGIKAIGPYPADTIFLRARDGQCDAVVSMFHDQGQIAMKLIGFDRGVSVQGGLDIPAATPCHGTAYDIAGQGKANPVPTRNAFMLAALMAENRKKEQA